MSDTSQGEGWWQASDGKWYPPSAVPAPPVPPAFRGVPPAGAEPSGSSHDSGQARTLGEPKRVRPKLLIGVTVAVLAVAAVVVLVVGLARTSDDESVGQAMASSTTSVLNNPLRLNGVERPAFSVVCQIASGRSFSDDRGSDLIESLSSLDDPGAKKLLAELLDAANANDPDAQVRVVLGDVTAWCQRNNSNWYAKR